MIDPLQDPRRQALAKLDQSREEIRQLLDPPPPAPGPDGIVHPRDSDFPRSRTMRAIMSSRGLGAIGALAGGLLIARPSLALKLLRLVPASAVGKMLIARVITQFRGPPKPS